MTQPLAFSGLLIDMDGLLLDTERLAEGCWHTAEVETGFNMPEGFYFTLIGQTMPMAERRLVEVMHPDCDITAFLRVANSEYKRCLLEGNIPVKSGARELLEYVRGLGVPVCLATSTFRELAGHKLESTGLAPFLPKRVCGDEVKNSKPDPEIYARAAGVLGLDARDLIALEDSENGMLSALDAGCQVIHVPDIAPVSLGVQARAHRVFRSLIEVRTAMERKELAYAAPNATGIPPDGP